MRRIFLPLLIALCMLVGAGVDLRAAIPTVQAKSLYFTGVGQNQVTVKWTKGTGARRLVLAKQAANIDLTGLNGEDYTPEFPAANANFTAAGLLKDDNGSDDIEGTKVVYDGTGNSATVTGLTAGTTYYFMVIEYNADGANWDIKNSTALNNPRDKATLDESLEVTEAAISNDAFKLTWGAIADADWYEVTVATDAAYTVIVDGIENADIGDGTEFVCDPVLNPSTQYYYRVRYMKNGAYSPWTSGDLTTDANATPTLTFTGALAYNEAAPAAIIDAGITLADANDDADFDENFITSTVQITGNAAAGDVLSLDCTDYDATATYNAGSYTLTITPTGEYIPMADMQTLLRRVKYISGNHPVNAVKTVTWDINDEDNLSDASDITSTINVTLVNDAPTMTAMTAAVDAVNEDTEVEITWAEIAAQANEADPEGTPLTFKLKAISAGSSLKVAHDGAAVAIDDELASGQSWFWTPAANANGSIWAFVFVAYDGELESTSNISAYVTVNAINDVPTFTVAEDATVAEDGDNATFTIGNIDEGGADDENGQVITVTNITSTNLTLAPVENIAIAYTGDEGGVDADGNAVVTVDPVLNKNGTSTITVDISDGTNTVTETFVLTVTAVNDAPTLASATITADANDALAYTEQGAAAEILTDLVIADVDNANISSATVTLAAGSDNDDVLSVDLAALTHDDIAAASFVYPTLTITTQALQNISKAEMQAILNAVKFANTTNDASDANRTVVFTINDGALASNTITRYIDYTAVNDVPTFTALTAEVAAGNEDTEIQISYANIAAQGDEADVDGTTPMFKLKALTSGTLRATAGGDAVAIDGTLATGGSWFWTPAANANGSIAAFEIVAWDGTAESTTNEAVMVTVNSVDDVPTYDAIASYTATVAEDGANASFTIANIDEGGGADEDTQVMTVTKISSTNTTLVPLGNVTITYGPDDGNDATGDATITVNPANDEFGSSDIVVKISDGNVANDRTETFTVTVTAVNDAPVLAGAGGSFMFTEGDAATVIANNLDITDVDNTNMTSATVTISANALAGDVLTVDLEALSLDDQATATFASPTLSIALVEGQTLTVEEMETILNNVKYFNGNDNSTIATRTVQYQVNDGALASNTVSKDIAFTLVNDLPTLTEVTDFSVDEDGTLAIAYNDMFAKANEADVDGTTFNFYWVATQNGVLYEDAPCTDPVDAAELLEVGETWYWKPAANANGDDMAAFTIRVHDGAGMSDLPAAQVSVDVAPVNDVPTLTAVTDFATNEDVVLAIPYADLATKADDADVEGSAISFELIDKTGANGELYSDASCETVVDAGARLATGGTWYWKPTADDNGDNTTAFRIKAWDGTALSADPVQVSVDVAIVNDAPALTANAGPFSFTEGGVAVTDNIVSGVTDVDDLNMTGAVITLTNAQTGDAISVTNADGITADGVVDNVITLSGTATIAQYIGVINSFEFTNNSDDPNLTPRTFTVTITDENSSAGAGVQTSVAGNFTINVTATADAPAIVTSTVAYTYNENAAPTAINDLVGGIVDWDDANMGSAVITLTDYQADEDVLAITPGAGITADASVPGTISLSGNVDKAIYKSTINSLTYTNTSNDPTAGVRNFTVTVTDANSDGAGAETSAAIPFTVTVVAANDAPVLATNAVGALAYTEQEAAKAILSDITVADDDDTNIESATVTISGGGHASDVLGVDNAVIAANGAPTEDFAGGVWSITGTVTKAQMQTILRALTFYNGDDNPTDADRTIEFVVNDGTTNSNTLTRTIDFTKTNDAPTWTSVNDFNATEDVEAQLAYADLQTLAQGEADPDNATINYRITAVSTGTLYTVAAGPVYTPAVLPLVVADGTTIAWKSDANANGANINAFTMSAYDGELSSDAIVVKADVSEVNDTPTDFAISASAFNENIGTGVVASFNNVVDAGGVESPAQAYTYAVVAGAGDADNALVTVAANGDVSFVTSPNFEAKSSYAIRVRVTDNGTTNTVLDAKTFDKAFTLTINDINEAPTMASLSADLAVVQETPYDMTFEALSNLAVGTLDNVGGGNGVDASDFLDQDVADQTDLAQISFIITGKSANWTLKYGLDNETGTEITEFPFTFNSGIGGGHLWVTPADGVAGNDITGFTIKAYDGALESEGTANVRFDIENLNDAPEWVNDGDLHPENFTNIAEDVDLASNSGNLVSELIADGINDPDNNAIKGIVISAVSAPAGAGVWKYSLNNGASWNDFPADLSDVKAVHLLSNANNRIRFVPAANYYKCDLETISITAYAWDQTNSKANGWIGTGPIEAYRGGSFWYSSVSHTFTLNVTLVNDAPILAAAYNAGVAACDEDIRDENGFLPIEWLTANAITDPSDINTCSTRPGQGIIGGGDDADAVLEGIAITAVDNTNGVWEYLSAPDTWTAIAPVTATSALLIQDEDAIRFTPNANWNGTAAISYRAWDRTSGARFAKVDPTGNTAFSSNTATTNYTVNPINDIPTGESSVASITIAEDPVEVPFNITGISGGPANEAAQVVTPSILSSDANIVANVGAIVDGTAQVTYTVADHWNGSAELTITLQDDAGTANDGIDTKTIVVPITVTPVNDAPTLTALAPLTINEDAAQQVVNLEGITTGGGESQTLTVEATSSNTDLVANPHVTYTSPNGTGTIEFTPIANASGTSTITVTVTDDNTAGGAEITTTRTFLLTVNAVNDAPTFAVIGNESFDEDCGEKTIALTGFDEGGLGTENAQAIASWTATSNNTDLIPNPTITVINEDAGTATLTYTPNENAHGTATITVTVTDDGSNEAPNANFFTRTFDIVIAPVNDQPVFANFNDARGFTEITNPAPDMSSRTINLGNPDFSQSLDGVIRDGLGGQMATLTDADGPDVPAGATLTISYTAGAEPNDNFVFNDDIAVNGNTFLYVDKTGAIGEVNNGLNGHNLVIIFDAGWTTNNVHSLIHRIGYYNHSNDFDNAKLTKQFSVVFNDGSGAGNATTVPATPSITITEVNDAPTITAIGDLTINEDGGLQTVNMAGIANGGEVEQTITVTASSSDPAIVPHPTVNYSTPDAIGTLTFTPVANANGGPVTITVTVTDNGANGGLDDNVTTETFDVTVTPVNDAPAITAIDNMTIDEDAAEQTVNMAGITNGGEAGQTITVTATSSHPLIVPHPTVTYSSPDATGTLKFTPVANATGTATITVTVTDNGSNEAPNDNVTTETFDVVVTPVNDAPTAIVLSANTYVENSGALTIGNLSTTDVDGPGATYTITAGGANFEIVNGNQLKLLANVSYETATSLPVTVQVADGGDPNLTFSEDFTVNITDVNEAPTAIVLSANTIAENSAANAVIGGLTVTDPDNADGAGLQTHTYVIGGADAAYFNISGNDLRMTNPMNYEDGHGPAYNITITATDDDASPLSSAAIAFTVNVTNVNEAPTNLAAAPLTFAENINVATTFATLSATDVDAGTTLTYSIVGGADAADFEIVGTSLKFLASPNFEAKNSYAVNVQVSDGALTQELPFAISITNVNEAPTDITIDPDPTSFNENIAANSIVATLGGSDPDAGAVLTYSLVPGVVNNNAFTVEGTNLKINSMPNYENQIEYTVRVLVSDGALTRTEDFTLTVNNLNEAPVMANEIATELAWTTDDNALAIQSNLTFTDEDAGATISKIEATFQSGYVAGQDVLTANDNGGMFTITPGLNGKITITAAGAPTYNDWVAAAKTISFNNTSDTPTELPNRVVRIEIFDNGNLTDFVDRTITVDDLNETPVLATGVAPAVTFTENGAAQVVLPNMTVVDAEDNIVKAEVWISANREATDVLALNVDDLVNFDVTGDGSLASKFTITAKLPANETPAAFQAMLRGLTFSNTSDNPSAAERTISFQVTDGGTPPHAITSNVITHNVTVAPVNDAPTDLAVSANSFNENIADGSVVANLSASDVEGNTFTYTLVAGEGDADNALFTIAGATLKITNSPNYEAKGSYSVRIRVTDNGTPNEFMESEFPLTVNDLNEAPTAIVLSANTIAENSAADAVIGDLTVTDPDNADGLGLQTHTYVIGGADAAYFNISGNDLRMTNPMNFEAAHGPAYSITITATDNDASPLSSAAIAFTVNVTNVNEAPTLTSIDALAGSEDTELAISYEALVAAAHDFADVDAGTTLRFICVGKQNGTLSAEVGNTLSATGVWYWTPVENENGAKNAFTVRAYDDELQSGADIQVVVNVAPVNDAPVLADAAYTLPAIDEDNDNSDGILVSALLGANVSDIDAGATYGIAVNGVSDIEGQWQYKLGAGEWDGIDESQFSGVPAFHISAAPGNAIRFVPNTDENGVKTFTFRAWDATNAVADGMYDLITSNGGATAYSAAERTATLTVNPINDVPTVEAHGDVTVEEDALATEVTLTGISAGADNEEAEQTVTVTAVAGTPALFSQFEVAYADGDDNATLTFTPAANANGSSLVTVTVNDGQLANNITTTTFNINVTAINDAPAIDAIADQAAIDEDAAMQTVAFSGINEGPANEIAQTINVTATSSNPAIVPNPTVNYIDGNATGSLTYTPVANAYGTVTITVTVTDNGSNVAPNDNVTTETFAVTVNPVNDAPTALATDEDEFDENIAGGSIVVNLSASDVENDELAYSIVGGADAGAFTIDGSTLKINNSPDYEAKGSYSVRIRVTDNGAPAQNMESDFTFTVNDLNEAPTAIVLSEITIEENNLANAVIGALTVTDPDNADLAGIQTHTYVLGGVDAAYFNISGNDLRMTSPMNYEAAHTPDYHITITATDNGTPNLSTAPINFVISVTNINEPPTNLTANATNFDENVEINAVVATFHADDEEGNVFFMAAAGEGDTDNDAFVVNADGTLTINQSPNFEAKNSYSVRVVAVDDAENELEGQFTFTVNDLNEAPTDITLAPTAFDENINAGTTVATLGGTDPDANTTLNYSLVAGDGLNDADNGAFTIDGTSLNINMGPNYEVQNSYAIRVSVSDGVLTREEDFTLTVNDVEENPTLTSINALIGTEDTELAITYDNLFAASNGLGDDDGDAVSFKYVATQNGTLSATSHGAALANGATLAAGQTWYWTPDANENDETMAFTVRAWDGGLDNGADVQVTVSVNAVNDNPTLAEIADPAAIHEDAGAQTIELTGISAGPENESAQTLTITATSDNPTLIPNPTFNLYEGGTSGSLAYAPEGDAHGVANITVRIEDNEGGSIEREFTVNVTSVNDVPTAIATVESTVLEDAPASSITITDVSEGADNESDQTLSFEILSNDNAGLFSALSVDSYDAGANTALINFTPAENANGTANLVVRITDNGVPAQHTDVAATINVTAVNDNPTLTSIANPAAILEDAIEQTITLTGISEGPADESAQTLTITATSDNTDLIPNPTVSFVENEDTGNLTYAPVANANGSATITVTALDNLGASIVRTFTVNVTAVNDAPDWTNPANLALNEGASTTVNLTNVVTGPTNENAQTIGDRQVVSDNVKLTVGIAGDVIILTANSEMTENEVANVTVTLTDDGANGGANGEVNIASKTFQVNLTEVNDVPTLTSISSLAGTEDTPLTITYDALKAASDIADEEDANPLFSVETVLGGGSLTKNGSDVVTNTTLGFGESFVYTPALNSNGARNIFTVKAKDSDDALSTTEAVAVNVNVEAVNDAPTLTTINEFADAYQNVTYEITYDELLTAANEADVDGDVVNFVFTGNLDAGSSLQIDKGEGRVDAVANTTIFDADDIFYWTPNTDDYNLVDAFTVVATDGSMLSATDVTVKINIEHFNTAPTDLAISHIGIFENIVDGSEVATITTTDADMMDTFTYALVDGDSSSNNAKFEIVGDKLMVNGDNQINFEQNNKLYVRIRTMDQGGLYTEKGFELTVVDQNDAPTLAANATLVGGTEDQAYTITYDALMTALNAQDEDASSTLTFEVQSVTPETTISAMTLATGESITWTPAANANGALAAFAVKVNDGTLTSNEAQVNVNVTAVNDAPEIADVENTAATFDWDTQLVEGASLTSTLSINDIDNPSITSATVKLTGDFNAGDVLTYATVNGILGSWNNETKTLTLSEQASLADYAQAIRNVKYTTNENRAETIGLEFKVFDGEAWSVAATRNLTLVEGLATQPTVQVAALTATNTRSAKTTLNWTAGNGSKRIIVAREGAAVNFTPADRSIFGAQNSTSMDLTTGENVGDGNRIVFNGSSASPLTLTGLNANTTYHFAAFEYNDVGGAVNYLTTNPATVQMTTSKAPTQLVILPIAGGDVINSGSNFNLNVQLRDEDSNPAYPTTEKTFNLTLSGAKTELSAGSPTSVTFSMDETDKTLTALNYVSKYGDANVVLTLDDGVDGLSAVTRTIDIRAAKPTNTEVGTALSFQPVTGNNLNVKWTINNTADGVRYLLVTKNGTADGSPTFVPQDGTNYPADTNWNTASVIVDNYRAIFNGARNTSVWQKVTSITQNTYFRWKLFTYYGDTDDALTYSYNTANAAIVLNKTDGLKVGVESGIELAELAATSADRKVKLSWTTNREPNNLGFELYRSNENDYDNFELVGAYGSNSSLASTGEKGGSYRFTDADPKLQSGKTYIYKLQAVLADGTKDELGIVDATVLDGASAEASLFVAEIAPNPVVDKVSTYFTLGGDRKVRVELLDMTGKLVMVPIEGQTFKAGERHAISFTMPENAASGQYILSVTAGDEGIVAPFMYVK